MVVIKLCAKIHRLPRFKKKRKKRKDLTIPNADKDEEQLEFSDIKKTKAETIQTKHLGIMAFEKSIPVERIFRGKGEKQKYFKYP